MRILFEHSFGAPWSIESVAKRASRASKRKPKEPSRARRPNVSKKPEISEVKIVLPPRRGHDFRCQRSGDRRASFRFIFGAPAGPLEIPWVLRSAHMTLAMKNSNCLETIDCLSSRLISVKPLRVGRFTPCETASGGF